MPDADHLQPNTLWSTSAFGLPAAPSVPELAQLGEHLAACRHGGRFAELHCLVHRLRGFVASHLVISVLALAFAGGAFWFAIRA